MILISQVLIVTYTTEKYDVDMDDYWKVVLYFILSTDGYIAKEDTQIVE